MDTIKYEAVAYISRRTTPKKAKELIHALLERVEMLERANASFGDSMEQFMNNLPDVVTNALLHQIDRQGQLPGGAVAALPEPLPNDVRGSGSASPVQTEQQNSSDT